MAKFTPNTLIDNRYLLTENISYDSSSGRQVWSATDKQTGRRMIGRFEANGDAHWFDDHRPVSTTVPQPLVPPSNALPQPSGFSGMEQKLKKKSRSRTVLLASLFGAALVIAFVYDKRYQIENFFQNKKEEWKREEAEELLQQAEVPKKEEVESEIKSPAPEISVDLPEMKWTDAVVQLNYLSKKNQEEKARLFVQAGEAFIKMRQTVYDHKQLDSLYVVYMGRGSNSLLSFRQNGDKSAQYYAKEWYKLALKLKPSVDLRERIERVDGTASQNPARQAETKYNEDDLFTKDP